MPIRVLPRAGLPFIPESAKPEPKAGGIIEAFQRYDDWFGGTREGKMDLDIAKAMKEPGSSMGHNRKVWMKALDMVDKGQIPTRDMFGSDEEFRYFKRVHADAVDLVKNIGTPAFKKEWLGEQITRLEDKLATAQAGGIGLDRIIERYKHPAEKIAMKLRAEDGLYQKNLEKMKEQYKWSPAAGPDTPVGRDDPYRVQLRTIDSGINAIPISPYAQGGRAGYAQGGIADLKRQGYQAGTAVTQIQPAQFIQDVGYDYAKQLAATTAVPLQTSQFALKTLQQDLALTNLI